MEIKERHYRTIPQLVRRDKGDVVGRYLGSDNLKERDARYLIEGQTRTERRPPFQGIEGLLIGVGPEHPVLIPSADGAIERMLLTIPNYAAQDTTMAQAYKSLLSTLPSSIRLVVLVQKSCESQVKQWLSAYNLSANADVSAFDDSLNISVWAEDGYAVCYDQDSGSTYFVEPFFFPRCADSLVAEFAANFTDLKHTRAPLYFQGGNILTGDNFFLIGADYPANSLQYLSSQVLLLANNMSPKEFIRSLYLKYLDHDRNVIYIGSRKKVPAEQKRKTTINGEKWTEVICAGNSKGTVQPVFHIDMFITLIERDNGKYKLLVGDPSAAYRLLGGSPPAQAMQNSFDDIADQLMEMGFDVTRNPLPLVYMDDPKRRERMWYFASANNALVQNSPEKRVWLPSYGYGKWKDLATTDAANEKIWSALGYKVDLLSDFHPFAECLGAVHCIKKYLARG